MKHVIALVCLVGCNQFFDLEKTESFDSGGDLDRDGVTDDRDNCPSLANDQANADGDAFGDACDTCPQLASTSTHDEDRDHVGDDCDACPGVGDFGEDPDGDGIGAVCEVRPAIADVRVAFEPFDDMPAGWQADSVAWTQSDDAIAPDADLPMSDRGLQNLSLATPMGVWVAGIGVTSRSRWMAADRYGIVAHRGTRTFACEMACSSAMCVGSTKVDGATASSFKLLPQPYTRVRMVASNGQALCHFEGSGSAPASAFPTDGATFALIASPRIRVAYFEYIE
ncbi:MAG TPA: hypothetical protein VMZ53_14385 [Kofleriaceae bacterium]|nr:hypothetical protein [Kofleriaceae bacterium]